MMRWFPGETLAMVERLVILSALRYFDGNKTKTAKMLDISVRTIDAKLKLYKEADNEKVPAPTTTP